MSHTQDKTVDDQIQKLTDDIIKLKEVSSVVRSNIKLLNSVYSSLNKIITFLTEDMRTIRDEIQNHVHNILEAQQKQLELLHTIIKGETNDSNSDKKG